MKDNSTYAESIELIKVIIEEHDNGDINDEEAIRDIMDEIIGHDV